MTERRYTLAEIDAMREFLRQRGKSTGVRFASDDVDLWPMELPDPPIYYDVFPPSDDIERELRTAMLGGVDPAEFTNRPGNSADDKTEN